MISERKLRANRANARASTGPRSAMGKARASRNAQRHGLTLSVLDDPNHSAELKELGRRIAGDGANEMLQSLGSQVVAAQIDLIRVRSALRSTFEELLNSPREQAVAGPATDPADNWEAVTDKLLTLDRYERRAISRRKRAIRAFFFATHDKFLEKDKANELSAFTD